MSTLKTNTIKNTDDVEMYLAKAWVNFNGTGTVAIRAAGNVSSITDNGTGDYTVNFASGVFSTADYCVVLTADVKAAAAPNTSGGFLSAISRNAHPSTASIRIETFTPSVLADSLTISAAFFR